MSVEEIEENISEIVAENSELAQFQSANIEEIEFIEAERVESIIESVLFASDSPVSVHTFKEIFKGTSVKVEQIRRSLEILSVEYAGAKRGVAIEEVTNGYQLRTKVDNVDFIRRSVKSRPFKLSGPALEVLSIVAYKQPVVKSEIDDIRGVESGHLLRALMEKNLVHFSGKSDLPGRPMLYATSRKFLEIFGLRNLQELPSLSQIDDLLPEGIGDDEVVERQTLSQLTDVLSEQVSTSTYSDGEEELTKITGQLQDIETTSAFFEEEKRKQREAKDADKARNLREALLVGQEISTRDRNWLERYDQLSANGQDATDVLQKEEESEIMKTAVEEFEGEGGIDIDSASEEDLSSDDFESEDEDESKDGIMN